MDTKSGRFVKLEAKWTVEEEKLANSNNKALYANFCGVDLQYFKRIAKCTMEKLAWDILEVAHDGTTTIKQSKMQMLTSRFESLRMQESKTIAEFYSKVCDLSNQAFALGEEYSNTKLVRKVLRSLFDGFFIKVTIIE